MNLLQDLRYKLEPDDWVVVYFLCLYNLYTAQKHLNFCHGNITSKNISIREFVFYDKDDEEEENDDDSSASASEDDDEYNVKVEFRINEKKYKVDNIKYKPYFINFDKSFLGDEKDLDKPITDLQYRAPESFFFHLVEGVRYTHKSDLFSLGIILGSLLCGKYVFEFCYDQPAPQKLIDKVVDLVEEDEKFYNFLIDIFLDVIFP